MQAPWGYSLSMVVGGLFFAPIMRRHGFTTMLDPLHQRFGRRMAALLYLPALTGEIFWSAAILTALGTTFGTVLNLDFTVSILLSAAVAVGYTLIGGLWAVALTDVVQLLLLVVGLWLVGADRRRGAWRHRPGVGNVRRSHGAGGVRHPCLGIVARSGMGELVLELVGLDAHADLRRPAVARLFPARAGDARRCRGAHGVR